MPTLYRPSSGQETIEILRPIATTTTVQAFGSADGYTEPGTIFGTDEDIMVAGTVVATDNADLTGVALRIILDGAFIGTAPLTSYDGANNFYQYTLGMLTEGIHTIEVKFPRTRRT